MAYRFTAWDGYFKTREMVRNGRAFFIFKRKRDALKIAAKWLAENPPQSEEGHALLEKTTAQYSPKKLCAWAPAGMGYKETKQWELTFGSC